MAHRLYRSRNKMIGGVCAGLARYFNVDPTIVRLLWVASVIFMGTGILFYLVCWILIPEEDSI